MTTRKTQPRGKAYWPVLGLLLAASAAALAFIAAPGVADFLSRNLPNFPKPSSQINLIITVILFAIFAMIGSLIVAAAVPRKKSTVTEVGLIKDRKDLVKDKKLRKLRQKEINREGRSR